MSVELINKINIFIPLITLFAVLWYTYETRKMQKRIKEQIDLSKKIFEDSLVPILAINVKRNGYYTIVNIGNGPAVNIKTEGVKSQNLYVVMCDVMPTVLCPNELSLELHVSVGTLENKNRLEINDFWDKFKRNYSDDIETKCATIVNYENAYGVKYRQRIDIDVGSKTWDMTIGPVEVIKVVGEE